MFNQDAKEETTALPLLTSHRKSKLKSYQDYNHDTKVSQAHASTRHHPSKRLKGPPA